MKDSERYYKELKSIFFLKGKREKRYLSNIKHQIYEYNDLSYDELIQTFGTPKDVLKSYYDEVDSEYIIKKLSIKRQLIAALLIIFCALIICFQYEKYSFNKSIDYWKNDVPADMFDEVILGEKR